ncbi:phosphotransferase family protein [Nocardia harenae]|uniref:phosphotransferase family protein n=1 Tax=Nocardia harenae TaxID=358707 RepID=UPI000835EA57|nr:phosphotransferase family protein [Nocardia harenae]
MSGPALAGQWGALQPWVAAALGGDVVDVVRLSAGNSRTSWKVGARGADGIVRRYVVRHEPGSGPLSGTPLNLGREQVVYAALADRGVAVPRLRAVRPGGDALITDFAAGDDRWEPRLLEPYLRELGALHAVPVDDLALPGFARSSRADLELWWEVHDRKAATVSPLVEIAHRVLLDCHPGEIEPVLCHGDAGPANFLHDGERVTALLDWEFSHLGDPHDDLAWISVRAWMFGVDLPDFAERVRGGYRPPAGTALDSARFAYWQAVVLLRNLIVVLSAIENGEPGRTRFVHLSLRPTLEWVLAAKVAEVAGFAPPAPPPAPADGPARPGGHLLDEITAGLAELLPAVAADPDATRRVRLMRRLAGQLAATWNVRVPPPPGEYADATAEQRLRELAAVAAAELSVLPRSARMAATALPTL